jgi:Fe2+ or Zn2+ uptake regulation protein
MFTEIFGDSPQVKVLDLLITQDDMEYTKKEIAECADVGRSTLYTFWDTLERYDIVKKTRRIGNTWLYRINTDSPAVKALQEFQLRVVDIIVQDETKEKKEQPKLNVSALNTEKELVSA